LHRDLSLFGWSYASRLSLADRLWQPPDSQFAIQTPRLTHKRLVLSRRRWLFSAVPRELLIDREQNFASLCRVERWRRRMRLPAQVFAHGSADHRPRFVDFTNAYSLSHVLRALTQAPGRLVLEEALPNPLEPEEHAAEEVERVWGFVSHRSCFQALSRGRNVHG
jgi:hypothetical protein